MSKLRVNELETLDGEHTKNVATLVDDINSVLVTTSTGEQPLAEALDDREEKGRSVLYVEDFGAVGDGVTDDTSAIQSAISALASSEATELWFDKDAIYSVSQINLSTEGRYYTNGCKFVLDDTLGGNTPGVLFTANNSTIDAICVDGTASFDTRFRAVLLSNVEGSTIGKIKITSDTQVAPASFLDTALRVINCKNTAVGVYECKNWDRASLIQGETEHFSIGTVRIENYVNGLNIQRGRHIKIGGVGGINIQVRSPNASVTPGHNGILIGNNGGFHYATSDVEIIDAFIRNSGEHNIRVSGSHHTRRIKIIRPDCAQSGGTNIKILSGDDQTFTDDLLIDSPVLEDALQEGVKLSCGIIAYRIRNGIINNPIIKARNATFSGKHGISVHQIQGLDIINPVIESAEEHGIHVRLTHGTGGDGDEGTQADKDVNNLRVIGGSVINNGLDGMNVPVQGRDHRNMKVDGTLFRGNGGYGLSITSTASPSAGQIRLGWFIIHGTNNSLGLLNVGSGVGNKAQLMFHGTGQFNNEPDVANGSTWHDRDAGQFKVLKSGVWTAI